MSRSNPTDNAPHPCVRWMEWDGSNRDGQMNKSFSADKQRLSDSTSPRRERASGGFLSVRPHETNQRAMGIRLVLCDVAVLHGDGAAVNYQTSDREYDEWKDMHPEDWALGFPEVAPLPDLTKAADAAQIERKQT